MRRLDDEQAADLSRVLSSVSMVLIHVNYLTAGPRPSAHAYLKSSIKHIILQH